MRTPEQIAKEILDEINPYVTEWLDSSYDEMQKNLIDTVRDICKEDLKPGLPDECVLGHSEVKFCSVRNSDGWKCKHCAI